MKIQNSCQDRGLPKAAKCKIQNSRGVSLYLAILIMVVFLALALGISAILFGQIKVMTGMGDSVMAFYAADTGIEKTIFYDNKVIPTEGTRGLCYMFSSCTDCNWTCNGCGQSGTGCDNINCTDCTLIYESSLDGKTYRVDATVSGEVTTIKSVGNYMETRRAIKVTRKI